MLYSQKHINNVTEGDINMLRVSGQASRSQKVGKRKKAMSRVTKHQNRKKQHEIRGQDAR